MLPFVEWRAWRKTERLSRIGPRALSSANATGDHQESPTQAARQAMLKSAIPSFAMAINESRRNIVRLKLDLTRLGESVRSRRQRRGWSLTELAQHSGVSASFISDLENGKGGRPNVEYLFLLAASLGTTIDALINRTIPEQHADESPKDTPVPPSLAEFARAQNLTPEEVQMLAGLNYRGKRPRHADAWRAIYDVVKLASK